MNRNDAMVTEKQTKSLQSMMRTTKVLLKGERLDVHTLSLREDILVLNQKIIWELDPKIKLRSYKLKDLLQCRKLDTYIKTIATTGNTYVKFENDPTGYAAHTGKSPLRKIPWLPDHALYKSKEKIQFS